MPRKDRLFELIQILRDGLLHRAEDLAARLNVSQRTIYRDMDRLIASGVPVQGARGVGYKITAQITLPPLNLTVDELEALHLGLAVANEVGDAELKAAAVRLSAKIDAVLPQGGRMPEGGWGFSVYPFADSSNAFHLMPVIRDAVRSRSKLSIRYESGGENKASVIVWPLNLEYWGNVWSCTTWCEHSQDFKVYRVDKIVRMKTLDEAFPQSTGKRYEDYLAQIEKTGKP
jgi:predicted DNA-binding transcriptional regulator YafY